MPSPFCARCNALLHTFSRPADLWPSPSFSATFIALTPNSIRRARVLFTHGLLGAVIAGALIGVLVKGLRALLARGGAGTQQGDTLVYGLRPGTRVLGCIVGLICATIWFFAALSAFHGAWQDTLGELLFGLPFLLLAGFALLQGLTLDATGLRYRRTLLRDIHIAWGDLSHYEVNASAIVSVLFLRTRSGGSSISVSNLAYNTDDLLTRVVERTGITQQPYKKRSWIGG